MNDIPGSLKFVPQHSGRKSFPGSEFLEFERSMRKRKKPTSSILYFSSAYEQKRLLPEQKMLLMRKYRQDANHGFNSVHSFWRWNACE